MIDNTQREHTPTINELLFIISKLEARIEALEHRQQKHQGIHLSGAPKSAKTYYDNKKKERERLEGDK